MGTLDGSVIIVTGAAQGIGYACADLLCQRGASVVIVDQNSQGLTQAVATLSSSGRQIDGVAGDVSDAAVVADVVNRTVQTQGHLDGLVNNAGVTRPSPFLDHSLADWQRTIDVNLTGTFLWCQAALAHMVERGSGSIVNISSLSAIGFGSLPHAAYTSSKAAILALSRELGYEFANSGVRINAILPGLIRTAMTANLGRQDERHGEPADIAKAVSFFLSPDSQFITGSSLAVAGGGGLVVSRPKLATVQQANTATDDLDA